MYLRPGTPARAGLDLMGPSARRRHPARRMAGGLGISDADLVAAGINPATGLPFETTAPAPAQTPTQLMTKLQTQTAPPQDPLSYVSPQAAIAAGLDPAAVNAAWSAAVNKFPTAQAAVASGVPSGVVAQFWKGGPSSQPAAASWMDQAPLGIANKFLLGIGAGVFALVSLGGGRRR